MDLNDSVGILDRYAPEAKFFTSPEKFEEYLQHVRGTPLNIDYVSICSPNDLHSSHIKMAFRHGANAICEKPIVLTLHEINELKILESETGCKVKTILQLRIHDAILNLKTRLAQNPDKFHEVDLTYVTSRGDWYHKSWKGNEKRSGGLTTNIGVHFFDMLTWVFGDIVKNEVHLKNHISCAGVLHLKNARVKWFVSIDRNFIPASYKTQSTYRCLSIDGDEFEFSEGFADLHTTVYHSILNGMGYGLDDVEKGIRIVEEFRNKKVSTDISGGHPFLAQRI